MNKVFNSGNTPNRLIYGIVSSRSSLTKSNISEPLSFYSFVPLAKLLYLRYQSFPKAKCKFQTSYPQQL